MQDPTKSQRLPSTTGRHFPQNTNRQLHALRGTIGRSKARELEARVLQIHPECIVDVREEWVTEAGAMALMMDQAEQAKALGQVSQW